MPDDAPFTPLAFIIPLRKHMIDYERLTYPGGVAVATILKSPGAGVQKAIMCLRSGMMNAIPRNAPAIQPKVRSTGSN